MAHDLVGQVESPPTKLDAEVLVTLAPWRNVRNPVDVNDDGFVAPLDALLVINYLNSLVGAEGEKAIPALNGRNVTLELNSLPKTIRSNTEPHVPTVETMAESRASQPAAFHDSAWIIERSQVPVTIRQRLMNRTDVPSLPGDLEELVDELANEFAAARRV